MNEERITSRRDGHWLVFNRDREVTGCHCGFEADSDSDCGWGDSVIDHIWNTARADAAEKAWDEGHEAGYTDGQTDILTPIGLPGIENPYRAVASHQEGGA